MIKIPEPLDDADFYAVYKIDKDLDAKLITNADASRAIASRAANQTSYKDRVADRVAGKNPPPDSSSTDQIERQRLASERAELIEAKFQIGPILNQAQHRMSVKIINSLRSEEKRIVGGLCESLAEVSKYVAELNEVQREFRNKSISPCGRFLVPQFLEKFTDKTDHIGNFYREAINNGFCSSLPKTVVLPGTMV